MTDTGQGSNRSPTKIMKCTYKEMNRSSKKIIMLYDKIYNKEIKNLAKFIHYKEISDTIISFHTKYFDKCSYPTSEYTAMLQKKITSCIEGIIVDHELTGKSH